MQTYEIREIDAIQEDKYLWTWNTSYCVGFFKTKSENPRRAFLEALRKDGITFKKGTIRVFDDGDILIIEARKTDEPLYAAIPVY